MTPVIACLDVGSAGKTGWALVSGDSIRTGADLEHFVSELDSVLSAGEQVALGFECPLYIPSRGKPAELLKQRGGEDGKPWSAGAGSGVLAVGLAQMRWVLSQLHARRSLLHASTRWNDLEKGKVEILLWEGFVSRSGPIVALSELVMDQSEHVRDAAAATYAFAERTQNGTPPVSDLEGGDVFSLAGAQILAAHLSTDTSLLSESCIVVKARKPWRSDVPLTDASKVWIEIGHRDYLVPMAAAWDRVYQQLLAMWKADPRDCEMPPVILILGGAAFTSKEQRREQWTATLHWAKRYGADPRYLVLTDAEKYRDRA